VQLKSDEEGFRDLTFPVFRRVILGLAALFLLIETICILRFPLVMDEFVDAEIIHALVSRLPHRDMPMGKTVLAYYLQLPALLSQSDAWRALLAVKFEMALFACGGIVYTALALGRDFNRRAVALAFVLLVTMSTFYERAADIRSDMLTGITGLFSLLCLIRRRPAWAGLWCGISLMMSQKGAYYVLATEAALLLTVAMYRRRDEIRAFFVFNVAAFLTFATYLLFWMALSSPHAVLVNTFLAQQTNAFGTHFIDIRQIFWSQTLRRNPVFYALSAAALAFLARRAITTKEPRSVLLFGFGVALTALCLWHKQPWPYFFVLLAPLLFVLQIPLLESIFQSADPARIRAIGAVLVAGAVAALAIRVPPTFGRDLGFQRAMFRIGDRMLREGGTYFAAVPILYTHRQAGPPNFNSVDKVQQELLEQLSPAELLDIVRKLDTEPIRFILFNYRIDGLPTLLRQYLASTFEPYWGALFIYSPNVRSGIFTLKFDGEYVVGSKASIVTIDGRGFAPGARLRLTRGEHIAESSALFRLRLDPASVAPDLDPRYKDPEVFFPAVYSF
jgi:hypothetical protein